MHGFSKLLCAGILASVTSPAWADDDVRYFASGWPISLAEAACDGDEGCLTQLANCGPGTDGNCTTQVARCTLTDDGIVSYDTLCTVSLDSNGSDVVVRLPDGDTGVWRNPDPMFTEAIRTPVANGPAACETTDGQALCVTHIIDTPTLTRWANGQKGN